MYQIHLQERLSEKIYQNTLVGREFVELEKELRQTINGIYAKTNDAEAKASNFINNNKFKNQKNKKLM